MRLAKSCAFTMSEMLTVLAVVGVIAIVALSFIIGEVNNKKNELTKAVFQEQLAVALAQMQSQGDLATVASEKEFAQKLTNYFPGAQIITDDKKKISETFATKYTDENGNKISTPIQKNSVQILTSEGVGASLNYDKSKAQSLSSTVSSTDPSQVNTLTKGYSLEAMNEALSVVKGSFYDVNGSALPNKIGKDATYVTKIEKTCSGNLVNVGGTCSCSLTNSLCEAQGAGMILNSDSCTCVLGRTNSSCDLSKRTAIEAKMDKNNAHFDETACRCKANNILVRLKCQVNGGSWDDENCRCLCDTTKVGECGYGAQDPENLCKFENGIKIVEENGVQKRVGLDEATFKAKVKANGATDAQISYTKLDANDDNGFSCAQNTANIQYTKDKCFCKGGCDSNAKASCTTPFKWTEFKDNDPNSCSCHCDKSQLEAQVKKLTPVSIFSSSYEGSSGLNNQTVNYSYTYACSNRNNSRCDHCGVACDNSTLKWYHDVYVSANKATSSYNQYSINSSDDKCYIEFKNSAKDGARLPELTSYVYYHGAGGIWLGTRFGWSNGTAEDITNPNKSNKNYSQFIFDSSNPLSDSYWRNSALKVKPYLYSFGDPIVLNNTSDSEINIPLTTNKINYFKIFYNGTGFVAKDIKWLQAKSDINKSYVFLAKTKGQATIPENIDVTYLFSDQMYYTNENGEKQTYSTGLVELRNEFDSDKNTLINANDTKFDQLRIWWDKNSDAKVQEGEIKQLSDLGIFEINTVVEYYKDAAGNILQNKDANYGIQGQYKKYVALNSLPDGNFMFQDLDIYDDTIMSISKRIISHYTKDKYYLTNRANVTTYLQKLKSYESDMQDYNNKKTAYDKYLSDKKAYEEYLSNKNNYDKYLSDKKAYEEQLAKYNKCIANNADKKSEETSSLQEDQVVDVSANTTCEKPTLSQPTTVLQPTTVSQPTVVKEPTKPSAPSESLSSTIRYLAVHSSTPATYSYKWKTSENSDTSTLNNDYIIIRKINNVYYKEIIKNLSDILFSFDVN